jgi:3-hydroxyisobutyrate dehydrogenase-like beta-hydroxyacid dehydrogenase
MTLEKTPGTKVQPIAMIGLGIMGSAIANNLVKAGFRVIGYDIEPARCDAARTAGIAVAASAAAASQDAGIVLTSLPSEAALDATVANLVSETGLHNRDLALVELSTLGGPCKSRGRDALAAVGISMLDCPISGTGGQAVTADIVLYSSGEAAVHERCLSALTAFSRQVYHLGEFGLGMKMKLVANHLVAILNVAAAEAINLAERAGIEPEQMLEVIGAGAAGFPLLKLRGPMMVSHLYEPATMKLDVWQKDMNLIEQFAAEVGSATPLFSATAPLYAQAIGKGRGTQDTAAVREMLVSAAEDPLQ